MTKRYLKQGTALFLAALFACHTAALAGTWQEGLFGAGTWNYYDTNEARTSGWKWLDGNKDGVFECYYFDTDGKLLQSAEKDGYSVNADGAWTENGAVVHRQYPSWLSLTAERQAGGHTNFSYPKVTLVGNSAGSDAFNQKMRALVDAAQQDMNALVADAGTEADTSNYESTMDYDVLLAKNERYTSISLQTYGYSGGAHGLVTESYFTITPDKGILSIKDLGGSKLEQTITAYVQKELAAQIAKGQMMLFDAPEKVAIDFTKDNWMLADDGLHVLFQQYEIAPYAVGLIDVCVPYQALSTELNAYGKTLLGME